MWNSSISWWKQFKEWTLENQWDIWTSRNRIVNSVWEITEPWLNLADDTKIKEWVKRIIESWNLVNEIDGWINIFFHAMNLMWVSENYPSLFISSLIDWLIWESFKNNDIIVDINAFKDKIKGQINAVLISFHDEYSEDNTNWSHVRYMARWSKDNMELSLLSSLASKKWIYDLEIFDSPSSEKISYPFIWTLWQFISFIESNLDYPYSHYYKDLLQEFLWEDYEKFLKFLNKYPLSWELWEWQISMSTLDDNEIKKIQNTLLISINSAKFAYITWIISDLYTSLSFDNLNNNFDDLFYANYTRSLATWEKIIGEMIGSKNFNQKKTNWKYTSLYNELDERMKYRNLDEGWARTNLLFVKNDERYSENEKNEKITEIDYEFNPTEKNFDIIGNSEVWWHFWRIPLFILNGVIYNSWILSSQEYVSSTKPDCILNTSKKITIRREWNNIIVFNTYGPGEIFAEIKIDETKISPDDEVYKNKWIIIPVVAKEYDEWAIPHWEWWFKKFSSWKIPENVFDLDVDPKATIIEVVWFEVAKTYFINPDKYDVDNLRANFNRINDFSNLNWVFSKVDMKYMGSEFNSRIKNANLDYYIVQGKTAAGKLLLTVDIFDWEYRMCQIYLAVS